MTVDRRSMLLGRQYEEVPSPTAVPIKARTPDPDKVLTQVVDGISRVISEFGPLATAIEPTSKSGEESASSTSSNPPLQTISGSGSITFPSPTTSLHPLVTEDARSSSSSPKLKIILPSVAGSLVLLVIIFMIMSRCYRRTTKRPRSMINDHITRRGDPAEHPTSGPNIIHPYDLKTNDQFLQSRISEPFPGESTQASCSNDLDSTIFGRRGIFERLLWRNGTNHSELPRPYELKRDLLPLANQTAALTSETQPHRASIASSPSISRPRPRSSSESLIARSDTQTESTTQQIQLREEADELRSQASRYERDFVRDEEMRRLRDRIQMLEMQVNSDRATGLTDDLPPSYRV
ncbi:hypothetical protein D9758_009070 [Tetrapyrgos nigripes]|uniref:Uncharacterized protein n=1 Tax=Tetrapyrgos nigripes TaxID=182062 RepID=A0A8H5GAF3_9AGAR|nr:hypothetical protein D9758_009070 [Tetrapyrgos nigripes]